MAAFGMILMFIVPILILLVCVGIPLWEWNDKRKTRKSIQNMAQIQAQSLQTQQMQNGFAPPPSNQACKWGK